MSDFNFQYASPGGNQGEQNPDRPPPPATPGTDRLRCPPPLPLHRGGASQLSGSLSSTTTNESLRLARSHSAAMSNSPARDATTTKHGVRQWARIRVQRLGNKFGSVATGVGSSASRHALTGKDVDASKPQSFPDSKTTSHKLLQSPFKDAFGSVGRKSGHQRATSDPNISLPQPIRLTDIKSPEERARDARMMDEFKFEWAKACRPGITMEDLRPNSKPYRSPDSEAVEAAYAAFRRKSGSTGTSGSSSDRSHRQGVTRVPAETVPEEPFRQSGFPGDAEDYFSQHRPHQHGKISAEYLEPSTRRSPGGNPPFDHYFADGSSAPPTSPHDTVQRSPATIAVGRYDRYRPKVSSPLSPNARFRHGAFGESGLIDADPEAQQYVPIVRPARGREELFERQVRVGDNAMMLHSGTSVNELQKAVQETYYMRDHPSPPVPAIQPPPKGRRTPPEGTISNPPNRRADSGVRLTMPLESWYSNISFGRTPEHVTPGENTTPGGTLETIEPSVLRIHSLRTIPSKQVRNCSNCGHTDIFPAASLEYEAGDLRPPFRRPDEDADFEVNHEGGKKRVVSRTYHATTPDSLTDLVKMWKKDLQFDPDVAPLKMMKKAVNILDVEYKGADLVSQRASMHDAAEHWHGQFAATETDNTPGDKRKGREQSTVSSGTHVTILKPLAFNPDRPSQPVGMPAPNITGDEADRASAADRAPTCVTRSKSSSRSRSKTRSSNQPIAHPPGYKYHSPLEEWSVKHREFLETMHRRPEFMRSKDEVHEWEAFISCGKMPSRLEDPIPAPLNTMWERFVAWQREMGQYPVETTEKVVLEQPPPSRKEGKEKEKVLMPENYTPGECPGSTRSYTGKETPCVPYETSSKWEDGETAPSIYLHHSQWGKEANADCPSNDGYDLAYSRLLGQERTKEQDMASDNSDDEMMQELNRLRSVDDEDDPPSMPSHKKYAARSTPTIEQLREELQQLRTAEYTPPPMAEKKNYKAITTRQVAEQARLRELQDEYSPVHNFKAHNHTPREPIARLHDAGLRATRRVSRFSRPKSPTTAMITGVPWTHTTHPTGISLISANPTEPLINRPTIPLIIPSAALRKGDKLVTATAPSEIQYYLRTSSTGSDTHCTVHTLSMGTLTPSHTTILRSRGMGRATVRYLKLIILDYRTLDGLTTLMTWDPEAAEDSTPRVIELNLVASHLWSMEFFLEAMRLAKEKAERTAIGAAYGFAQVWVVKGVQGQDAWYVLGWAEPGQCVLTRATGVGFDEGGGRCVKYRRFCAGMRGMRGMAEVEEGGMRAMTELYGECGICGETGGMF